MKKLSLILSSLIFLAFYACSDVTESTNVSNSEDEAAIKAVLDADDLSYDELDDGTEESFGVDDPNWLSGGFEKDGIRMRFGRRITERAGNVDVVFTSDTTATAYVNRTFSGKFVSVTGELIGDTLSLNRFEKPLVHHVERIVNLYKFRDDANLERRNWKIENISMAEGQARPTTVNIVELVILPEGQDSVVITNPTEYFINGVNLFTFPRFKDVTVRVKVENNTVDPVEYPAGSSSTENVRLHYGRNRLGHHAKRNFRYIGEDGMGYKIYEGTWTVQQFGGVHHAVIDVIDNGTILNQNEAMYPYSSSTWSTPYRVTAF